MGCWPRGVPRGKSLQGVLIVLVGNLQPKLAPSFPETHLLFVEKKEEFGFIFSVFFQLLKGFLLCCFPYLWLTLCHFSFTETKKRKLIGEK